LLVALPADYVPPLFRLDGSGRSGAKPWTEEERDYWARELLSAQLWAERRLALPLLLKFVPLGADPELYPESVRRGWNEHLRVASRPDLSRESGREWTPFQRGCWRFGFFPRQGTDHPEDEREYYVAEFVPEEAEPWWLKQCRTHAGVHELAVRGRRLFC